MGEEYITRHEHNEFASRIDAENKRQNRRLDALDENVKQISKLTVSVEKMAVSTETMARELGRQGERLEALETAPAKRWNAALTAGIGTAIGAGITAVVALVVHAL